MRKFRVCSLRLYDMCTVSLPPKKSMGRLIRFHHQKSRTLEQRIIVRFTSRSLLNDIYTAVPCGESWAHIHATFGRVKHDDIFVLKKSLA